jgi:hypothetical protein
MSQLVSVSIPAHTRAPKERFDAKLITEAAERLRNGEAISLGETYDKRSKASVMAYYLRQAVADEIGLDAKRIRSRTFEADDGYAFGVYLRPEPKKPAATAGRGKRS